MVEIIVDKSAIPKKGTVVIDFFATWCGPCSRIAPMYDVLSKEYTGVRFFKVDVDMADELATEYDVTALPTFVCLKDGKVVGRVEGANLMKLGELLDKFSSRE